MSGTSTSLRNSITLRGSTEIVTEFFGYSINHILYQRGIYPPDSFKQVYKYGIKMLVTSDDGLQRYLGNVLSQLSTWLMNGQIQQLVIVISSVETQQTLERWAFKLECDRSIDENHPGVAKSEREIQAEIAAVIRQITACVSFLPLLNEPCTFDLLVYTDEDVSVPSAWEESDPKYVTNSTEVSLRSFTTSVHKVSASVHYRNDQPDEL
eukprot:gnl/Trimastix_PCT/512.p1 GENE.gnl/Trimastix_PCT/512~~gnl/Trimastix_PCT/512.p1  ORF type:complete len:209 (+),score=15.43 gnl/Trimastix_PCT/512:66-692(+)